MLVKHQARGSVQHKSSHPTCWRQEATALIDDTALSSWVHGAHLWELGNGWHSHPASSSQPTASAGGCFVLWQCMGSLFWGKAGRGREQLFEWKVRKRGRMDHCNGDEYPKCISAPSPKSNFCSFLLGVREAFYLLYPQPCSPVFIQAAG